MKEVTQATYLNPLPLKMNRDDSNRLKYIIIKNTQTHIQGRSKRGGRGGSGRPNILLEKKDRKGERTRKSEKKGKKRKTKTKREKIKKSAKKLNDFVFNNLA